MDARSAALSVLRRVEEDGAYSNLELDRLLKSGRVEERERGLTTKLVYGTLQNRLLLDQVLRGFIRRGYNRLKPAVKNALRMAVYQILMLDSIPDYAAIDAAVSQVRKADRRSAGLSNASLRNIAGNRERILKDISEAPAEVRASVPDWIADLYRRSYGEDADKILEMTGTRPPLAVRANTLVNTRAELVEKLAAEGIGSSSAQLGRDSLIIEESELPAGGIDALASFQDGGFIVQDAGAALIGEILDPQPGSAVADLCAAPGGKTTHLSALMDNTGTVLAGDLHENRLELIRENARRLGCTNIEAVKLDAAAAPGEDQQERFDAVLLDAPCSGLGIIRRKPDIRYRVVQEDLAELEKLQSEMLDSADLRLKPGGRMVYSTCTVNPGENGDQVRRFLKRHPDYTVLTERQTSPLEQADCFYMCELKKA